MKINYKNICLLFLLVGLSACPYKEIYKPVVQEHNIINGLRVSPVVLFYNSHKGQSTCEVDLRINNQSDLIQKVSFSKSYLINSSDTLAIEKIYALGTALSIEHIFNIPPKMDTTLGFMFKDLEKNFGDTIRVVLVISGFGNNTFIYKKT